MGLIPCQQSCELIVQLLRCRLRSKLLMKEEDAASKGAGKPPCRDC